MTNKMTQKNAIAFVLENCELPTEVREKVEAIQKSLERKSNSTGEKKPTKTQIANEGYKQEILSKMEPERLYTVTEITKEIFDNELSSQRVSALIKQLKDTGKVERIEDKRKAMFKLV